MNIFTLRNQQLLVFLTIILFIGAISCSNPTPSAEQGTQVNDIASITEQIDLDRTNASLFHDRALLLLKTGNFEGALNDIKIAIKLNGAQSVYHYTSGEILFAKGDIVLAAAELQTCISLDPNNLEAVLKLAELQLYMQKYKKCILSLKKAIQLDKHNAHAYYVQGLVFKQIGDTGKAIDSWRTATDYNADHFDSYLQLGITQYERGNPIAEHYLANAFALDPKNIELLYAMGMFYQNYGSPDKAIDTYYSILSLNINQPKVHYNLGYIHISVKEDYTTGHEHFANAIKSDSTYADAYYMRGLCEENLGKYRNARLDYQQCLELATNHDLAILGLNRLDDAKR